MSIKTNAEVFTSLFAMPKAVQWINYVEAWTLGRLGWVTLNSLKVSVGLVLCLEYYEQIRQTIENGWYHIKDNRMLETELFRRTFIELTILS